MPREVPWPHLGEILLEEFLKSMALAQYRLAKGIGVPQRRIGEIVADKRAVTVNTDLRLALTAAIREHMALHPADFDPRQYLKPARDAIKGMVQHKIKNVLNCSGKA